MKAGVADGEALTEFRDESVDAVTCTWGLFFMPNWQRAVQVRGRVVVLCGGIVRSCTNVYDFTVVWGLRLLLLTGLSLVQATG